MSVITEIFYSPLSKRKQWLLKLYSGLLVFCIEDIRTLQVYKNQFLQTTLFFASSLAHPQTKYQHVQQIKFNTKTIFNPSCLITLMTDH